MSSSRSGSSDGAGLLIPLGQDRIRGPDSNDGPGLDRPGFYHKMVERVPQEDRVTVGEGTRG